MVSDWRIPHLLRTTPPRSSRWVMALKHPTSHEKFDPSGVMQKYVNNGGGLYACGTCLDSRDLQEDDLRPRATMDDCLRIIEDAEKALTIG